jgi:hypothetical protein
MARPFKDFAAAETVQRLRAEGLTYDQIAVVTGISKGSVYNYLRDGGGLSRKNEKADDLPDTLTAWQEAVLLGCVLGDGHLNRPKPHHNTRLELCHGDSQYEYLDWKIAQFPGLFSSREGVERTLSGKYHTRHEASFRAPVLNEFFCLFYPDGVRRKDKLVFDRVDANGFVDAVLAVWYMDDGHLTGTYPCFSVGCLDAEQYSFVSDWLRSQGFSHTFRMKTPKLAEYRILAGSSVAFFSAIEPYVHPSLAYKLGERRK